MNKQDGENKKNFSYANKLNTKLEKDFAEIREKLLDLSMRNQLINFRARSRSVEVINDSAENIYEYLVLKEKKMQFLPRRNKFSLFSENENKNDSKTDNDLKIENTTLNSSNNLNDSQNNPNTNLKTISKETDVKLTDLNNFNEITDNENELNELSNGIDERFERIYNLTDKQSDINNFIKSDTDKDLTTNTPLPQIENTDKNKETTIDKTNSVNNNFNTENINFEEDIFKEDLDDELDSEEEIKFYSEKKDKLWEIPDISLNVINEHKRRYLKTKLSPSELQRRLFYINQRAMTTLQEQGHNILYLALGFLEWYDDDKHPNDPKLAPLILIPVLIERRNIGKSFYIKWDGQDILTNLSLQMKFKRELDVELPNFTMPQNADGITNYINKIKEVIHYIPKWKVHDKIQLGFFSFSKFVMYQDLNIEHTGLDISKKPLIKQMFPNENLDNLIDEYPITIEDEYKINQNNVKNLKYEDLYNVLDADSSQMDVIEYVKTGHNLVVDGPPGTGKSQTIVNLIAELMASGKTVLFVSEKMAALEVVKNRLDNIGLGKFCLELHSHKTRKSDVLKDLENSLKDNSIENIDIEREINRAETLKNQLNAYTETLHTPLYGINKSPFELIGLKESAEKRFGEIPYVKLHNPSEITSLEWEKSLLELENLSKLSQLLPPISNNPWKGTNPNMIMPNTSRTIETQIIESLKNLELLLQQIKIFEKSYYIKNSKNLFELEKLKRIINLLKDVKLSDYEILASNVWDYEVNEAYLLIKNLKILHEKSDILNKFHDSILEKDLKKLIKEYSEESSNRIKIFSSKYRRLKKEIEHCYNGPIPSSSEEIIDDLESVNDFIKSEKQAKKLFGSKWNISSVSVEELENIVKWVTSIRELINEQYITLNTIKLISEGIDKEKLYLFEKELQIKVDNFLDSFEELIMYLNTNSKTLFGEELTFVNYINIREILKSWMSNINLLLPWSQYLEKKNLCLETKGAPFVELIENGSILFEDIKYVMDGNLADSLLAKSFEEISSLHTFIGELHQNKIDEFRDLDIKLIELNRKRLYNKLNKNMPQVFGNAFNYEANVLSGEFTRKRGHLPLRKLFVKAGKLITQIKPCFMMSPLSIAQYLDPTNENMEFDVVIFDEASQVKPEDALGAFLRGKNAVVMGDTKQLPPTSFFDQVVEYKENKDIATAADMESILHLCKRQFKSKMLIWHYRSRHESLIAVSNHEFYDNSLLIYPSASQDTIDLGLKHYYIPESIYSRGKGSFNQDEAKIVVQEVFKHFKRYGFSKSLGIGTFSVAQMNAILEELERMRKEHPHMEKYFNSNDDESFFVKNLETIQGDERDVIFISVGYGFSEDGIFTTNFGPLNQEGGERRLNVLITRAREKCFVFSNFKATDLKITNNTPFGVKALKTFLHCAEFGSNSLEMSINKNSLSAFEDSIYDFLVQNGFEVKRNIGCAGFRIDMAIEDKNNPGTYSVGIISDGKMYNSSVVARDRDRLREQVLRGLGWSIVHVWSTDWYRNKEETKRKLLETIKVLEIEKQLERKRLEEELAKIEEDDEFISNDGNLSELDTILTNQNTNPVENNLVENESEINNGLDSEDINMGLKNLYESQNEKFDNIEGTTIEDDIPKTDLKSYEKDFTNLNENEYSEDEKIDDEIEENSVQKEDVIENKSEPKNLDDEIKNYEIFEIELLKNAEDLYNIDTSTLSELINEIVFTEGPIHIDELIRRIRESCNIRRAGPKVKKIIQNAIKFSKKNGTIKQSGNFLLDKDLTKINVRKRRYNVDIKLISNEEIISAINLILKYEDEMNRNDLIIKVSRIFGFKATSKKTSTKINNVIQDMLVSEKLLNTNDILKLNKDYLNIDDNDGE